MISVAAIRMQQFGVQFYQASLTASDIDKLVRFEVLSYGDQSSGGVRGPLLGNLTHFPSTCCRGTSARAERGGGWAVGQKTVGVRASRQ